jgi:putative phosphoribosyl transferase
MFKDRTDAGQQLAVALKKYKDKEALVLGIPRGGVEVAYEVAKYLDAELAVIVSRKIPHPEEPELGIGAIAEDGSTFILEFAKKMFDAGLLKKLVNEQEAEIERRIKVLRAGQPLPEIKGRTVIIVDDGIAMGVTMRAAIMMCRNAQAGKIVAAAPVSGMDVADEVEKIVDELVVLDIPDYFQAVGQVYERFNQLEDEGVIEIMREWEKAKKVKHHVHD